MKKHISKILLLLCSLVFFSCQKDDSAENVNQENAGINIERKAFKEFHELPELLNKHFKNNTAGNLLRGNGDPLYDFEIDSTIVIKMIKDRITYYTISIYRNQITDGGFENLVISESESDDDLAHIIKYYPSPKFLSNLKNNVPTFFSGELNIIPLDYKQLMSRPQFTCFSYTETSTTCTNGAPGTPAGAGCYTNSDGGAHLVRTFTFCKELSNINYIIGDSENPGGGGGGIDPGITPPTPIVTQPLFLFSPMMFISGLSPGQRDWWDIATTEEKDKIIEYLKQNTSEQEFAKEMIGFYVEENIKGRDDLKNKIKQAIANGITSTAELTHKVFKKLSHLAQQYPSSKSFINSLLETINEAAATVTNTNPQTCTFTDFFNMWLFELGPNPINITGSNATSINQLKNQEGVNQARNIAQLKSQNGDFSSTNHSWTYGQGEFYDGMSSGNFVTAFLGSYSVKITISSSSNGKRLNFHVTNTSSWESATRFRIDNDGDGVHDGIFPNTYRSNNNDLSTGGNHTQNWNWSEPLN